VAGIDPIATAIQSGDRHIFVGDAIFKTIPDQPYTYKLCYRRMSASEFTAIVIDASGPKRGQPLGQLDTTGLGPGDYVVELELSVPGLERVAVQRTFTSRDEHRAHRDTRGMIALAGLEQPVLVDEGRLRPKSFLTDSNFSSLITE
jgi:hypothetical protein